MEFIVHLVLESGGSSRRHITATAAEPRPREWQERPTAATRADPGESACLQPATRMTDTNTNYISSRGFPMTIENANSTHAR